MNVAIQRSNSSARKSSQARVPAPLNGKIERAGGTLKMVQMRTKVMNQLHAIAMGQGLCRKKKLWSKAGRQELEALALEPWASRRRKELLELLDQMEKPIAELDSAVEKQAAAHPAAVRLMTHPGVGR